MIWAIYFIVMAIMGAGTGIYIGNQEHQYINDMIDIKLNESLQQNITYTNINVSLTKAEFYQQLGEKRFNLCMKGREGRISTLDEWDKKCLSEYDEWLYKMVISNKYYDNPTDNNKNP